MLTSLRWWWLAHLLNYAWQNQLTPWQSPILALLCPASWSPWVSISPPDLLSRGTSHQCARRVITTYGQCAILGECCHRTSPFAFSIVSSRLDYCNGVLYGTPNSTTQNLQKVQNCLARVVLQQRKSCHAQPLLKSLHWLPITQRINFKLATLAFKVQSLLNLNTFVS